MLWAQWLSGGIVGLLIEIFFTSFYCLRKGDWILKGTTSIWMILPYGTARIAFDWLHNTLHYNRFIMALIETPLVYLQEFMWGLFFVYIIKRRIWDYGVSKVTPMGLINLKYLPFWFTLMLFFNEISFFLNKLEKLVF